MPSTFRDTPWHWSRSDLSLAVCLSAFTRLAFFVHYVIPGGERSSTHQPNLRPVFNLPHEHFRSPRVTQPRLLLVDDEEIFVRGLSRELSKLGWQVQTADNAESALRALRQNEFDALVVDQELPGPNGVEVLS